MKIIAILKQVPDAEARLRVVDGRVDLAGATLIIDGMDEYGVEEALRLREGGHQAEIIALALGPRRCEEALRAALALGADRGVHIETDQELDPIAQAEALAQVIAEEQAELVLVGGKQADWDSSALGPAVAEALGWPHSDWTTRLELSESAASVIHDSDEGSEALTILLPAVITTQQGLNEPRYPTLPNIMKAKRKELKRLSLTAQAKTVILKQEMPSRARLNKLLPGDPVEAARELARLLHEEAKVI